MWLCIQFTRCVMCNLWCKTDAGFWFFHRKVCTCNWPEMAITVEISSKVRLFMILILVIWLLQTHSEVAGFKCHQCGSEFKHKSSLSAHMKCHASSGLLSCPVIGCRRAETGFLLARSLQNHILSHRQQFLCASVSYNKCVLVLLLMSLK
jgi:hypothetical protein